MDSTDKLLCALSYPIGLVAILLLLTKKENRACRYHAINAIGLCIAGIIFFTAVSIVLGVIGAIPGVGLIVLILGPLSGLLGLAYLGYSVFLAFKTFNGEYPTIPYVTQYVSKYVDQQ